MGGVDDTPLWRRHATRQRVHQATHTANTAKHTKRRVKRTMSAYTPCALRSYTLVLRLTAVTLTHVSGETRHSHEEEREESALAQVLFNTHSSHHHIFTWHSRSPQASEGRRPQAPSSLFSRRFTSSEGRSKSSISYSRKSPTEV